MFTGIIETTGIIQALEDRDGGRVLEIACPFAGELKIDQSISINGVCLTVTACGEEQFRVQAVEETLRKTTIGQVSEGDTVNLERSLRPDGLLDGHIVQGHVDAAGTIVQIEKEGTDRLFTIGYPREYQNLVVGRGSVAVDGISLTVASESGNAFTVAIIPYTFEHTNLAQKKEGDRVNLEFDILGKYVARYLENRDQ